MSILFASIPLIEEFKPDKPTCEKSKIFGFDDEEEYF
jgi:hypothetical protein